MKVAGVYILSLPPSLPPSLSLRDFLLCFLSKLSGWDEEDRAVRYYR